MDDPNQDIFEVALFNGDRLLIGVKQVSKEDYVTDPTRRQMALPKGHDVHKMIGKYEATHDYSRLEPVYETLPRILDVEMAGWALARWQTVEELLYQIFATLLRGAPNDLLRPMFFAITNLRTRIDVVTILIDSATPSHKNEWAKLATLIQQQSKRRNKLVHFGFMFINGNYVFYDNSKHYGNLTAGDYIDAKQLKNMCVSFGDLSEKLISFLCAIESRQMHGSV